MRRRCLRASAGNYHLYGGRGITVCERWRKSFEAFFADLGPRPSKDHSLDRIDNDGNYEPGNCRWATEADQQRNRRDCMWVEYRGERLPAAEWASRLGMRVGTLKSRVRRWGVERALSTPAPLGQWSNAARGEATGHTKLTAADVVAIRRAAASGAGPHDLARRYGVTESNVRLVVGRKTWKHIPEPRPSH